MLQWIEERAWVDVERIRAVASFCVISSSVAASLGPSTSAAGVRFSWQPPISERRSRVRTELANWQPGSPISSMDSSCPG